MFGCMEDLVVDNGLEFHGDSLESVCLMMGINISYCPRKKSWWKGHIERAIGTLNRAVTDGLPGRTFAGIKEKGDYNPAARACIPLDTMEEIIAKWIVDVYHETVHTVSGLKPREAWEDSMSLEDIPMVSNIEELDAVMGVIAIRTFSHHGIEINSLRYNSDELGQVKQQFGDQLKQITIKWDPEDLGHIYALPPNGKVIRVPVNTRHTEYATGLTLYQHTQCKAYSKKYLEGKNDVEALSIARAEIRELAEKGIREVSKKTRVQNHRLLKQDAESKTESTSSPIIPALPAAVPKAQDSIRPKFTAKLSNRTSHKD